MRTIFLVLFLVTQSCFSQGIIDFVFKANDAKGGIVIQNKEGSYWAHNDEFEVRKKTPPAATYQLLSFLMITEEFPEMLHREKYPWDGVHRGFFGKKRPDWELSAGVIEAFHSQNDYFFDALLSKISVSKREQIHQESGYTNPKWRREIPYYWQFGGLEVTATDQIELLKKLYAEKLPFSRTNQQMLKKMLLIEKDSYSSLYGISAYTIFKGEVVSWFIGWYETSKDVYFFSSRSYHSIEDELPAPSKEKMKEIVKQVFEELSI